jgi:hypothetical protein
MIIPRLRPFRANINLLPYRGLKPPAIFRRPSGAFGLLGINLNIGTNREGAERGFSAGTLADPEVTSAYTLVSPGFWIVPGRQDQRLPDRAGIEVAMIQGIIGRIGAFVTGDEGSRRRWSILQECHIKAQGQRVLRAPPWVGFPTKIRILKIQYQDQRDPDGVSDPPRPRCA